MYLSYFVICICVIELLFGVTNSYLASSAARLWNDIQICNQENCKYCRYKYKMQNLGLKCKIRKSSYICWKSGAACSYFATQKHRNSKILVYMDLYNGVWYFHCFSVFAFEKVNLRGNIVAGEWGQMKFETKWGNKAKFI